MSNVGDNFKLEPVNAERTATVSEVLRISENTPEASAEVAIFMFVIGGVAVILSTLLIIWLRSIEPTSYAIVHNAIILIVGLAFIAYGIWCFILKNRLTSGKVYVSKGDVLSIDDIAMSSDCRVMCLVNGHKVVTARVNKSWCKDMNIVSNGSCVVGWIHGANPTLI